LRIRTEERWREVIQRDTEPTERHREKLGVGSYELGVIELITEFISAKLF
jgi:hypothetical protein